MKIRLECVVVVLLFPQLLLSQSPYSYIGDSTNSLQPDKFKGIPMSIRGMLSDSTAVIVSFDFDERIIKYEDYAGKDLFVDTLSIYSKAFTSIDPLSSFMPGVSPYVYCNGDPMSFIDPTGENPIYSNTGNFLGTDNRGLTGPYIIMEPDLFTQGMPNEEAMNCAFPGTVSVAARRRIENHYSRLPERPDYDGFVTIDEGVAWAKSHPGALTNSTPDNTLYVDTSKLDFGSLGTSAFLKENAQTGLDLFTLRSLFVDVFSERKRGTVYALGRINMILISRSTREVIIVNDSATYYDWNRGGSWLRDLMIRAERLRTGLNDSHGFKVYYYGVGKLHQ